MKIKKYNMGDNGDVFVTMENNDTLALKWLPFKGDMTMVEIDMFKGEDSIFDSSYRAFLTKSCSLNNGEFVYNLYASIDDAKGEKTFGSHIVPFTERQYYRPQKESSLKKLVQCFYKVMKGESVKESLFEIHRLGGKIKVEHLNDDWDKIIETEGYICDISEGAIYVSQDKNDDFPTMISIADIDSVKIMKGENKNEK